MPGADGDALRAQGRSRGWDVPEMARRLRRAAGDDPLPEHSDLVRMIRRWERGTYRLSERYELLYAAALGVPPTICAGQATPVGNPSGPRVRTRPA